MSSDVQPLSEIAAVQGGYAFKSADFGDEGIAVIKIANIQPPLVSLSGVDRVKTSCVSGLERFELNDGDILMAMTGATVGKVGRFIRKERAFLNQRVARITARDGKEFDDFIYAVLSLNGFDKEIENASSGSAQPNISAAGIGSILIPKVCRDNKISIGSLAKNIDDRITLLRETNATLEAIAQALFKSWFVDFDPVRAKAEGLEPEGMDAATAALFPDSFEESELGLVPSGWKVGKVEDLMELPYGKALKATDRVDGPVPVYGSGGITGCHNESLVNGPSVIVGRKGTVGSLYWEDRAFFPIDTVFYVRTDNPLTYCYYLLQTLGLEDMNTDGAVPGLNRNNAYRLPVVVATTSIIESFDEIVSSLRNKMFSNSQHTQTLIQLRDTLLPRLISGQLRLPEAEVMVEEICA